MNISILPRNFLRYINIILLPFFLVIIYIIISSERYINSEHAIMCAKRSEKLIPSLPVVKIYGIEPDDKKLDVVRNNFLKMGYEVIFNETKRWDVLWSHTYPFYSLKEDMINLRSYQKVNHFPGSGYLTQKNNLAALPITHIPKSFILPANKEAFLKYAEDNNNMFWIIKNSNHRGIKIYSGKENLDVEGTFVQEFIKDPLLISGKKFDIGVYVVLASIDPLRVYVYNTDILLRICKENYFPLNINSVDSYVVGDDYLPIWEEPALNYYYSDLNYTAKESLNAYINSKGKNSKILWHQIYQIIINVYFSVEEDFKKSATAFGNVRGDVEVSDRDIQVNSEQCSSKLCKDSCENTKCNLCNRCMNKGLRDIFKSAYVEFMNKGKFKKIIPVPIAKISNKELKKPSHVSQMNAYMDAWFKGKCLQDLSWCN